MKHSNSSMQPILRRKRERLLRNSKANKLPGISKWHLNEYIFVSSVMILIWTSTCLDFNYCGTTEIFLFSTGTTSLSTFSRRTSRIYSSSLSLKKSWLGTNNISTTLSSGPSTLESPVSGSWDEVWVNYQRRMYMNTSTPPKKDCIMSDENNNNKSTKSKDIKSKWYSMITSMAS